MVLLTTKTLNAQAAAVDKLHKRITKYVSEPDLIAREQLQRLVQRLVSLRRHPRRHPRWNLRRHHSRHAQRQLHTNCDKMSVLPRKNVYSFDNSV